MSFSGPSLFAPCSTGLESCPPWCADFVWVLSCETFGCSWSPVATELMEIDAPAPWVGGERKGDTELTSDRHLVAVPKTGLLAGGA
eukprot:6450365-Amphidinium_carterae.1